ncbi:TetR family transcriptional regulator [Subtercola endophyticus]|uniref:TetR family transcriptional regulator n=1 Tax=Subtercola endophyticus TaxID=2895559 RepID=UPI001E36FAD2|nr:TetR family transcriptional regulator [Subtercola endophyticus]UFS60601.1 TetR family transcriptional regulator [Subtercola endophyticus]
MGRASKAEQEQHRQEILDAAARQVKARGIDAVTIPEVMAAVGLTRGGFYGHFSSKADLTAQAITRAFEFQARGFSAVARRHPGDHSSAVRDVVDYYFSDAQLRQADLDQSCPIAALSADVAREPEGSAARDAYAEGIAENLALLASLGDRADEAPSPEQRADALVTMAMAVGAVVIARATSGHPISAELVAAVKAALG